MRKLWLFTEPSVADPSQLVPILEQLNDGEYINYGGWEVYWLMRLANWVLKPRHHMIFKNNKFVRLHE